MYEYHITLINATASLQLVSCLPYSTRHICYED